MTNSQIPTLTRSKNVKTTVLFTFNLLLVTAFAACGQERPEQKATTTEAQREAAQPVMAKKIKVDKSSPKIMYINTNNVRIYDLDNKQIQSSGVDTNVPALEQFMKYDKVTLYDTKGDWVYVEGQARDTKTSVVRPVGGWVAKDTVEDWQPEKFFLQTDNVFRKIAAPIPVYDDSLEGVKVDEIAKGDTLRVLKGNGERFFVVSKQGKEGWIDTSSIDTTQLVAKGFGYKHKIEKKIPPSSIMTNNDGSPAMYKILPSDMTDPHIITGNFDKVPMFIGDSHVMQNGKEVNIAQAVGYKEDEADISITSERIGNEFKYSYKWTGRNDETIDGVKYTFTRVLKQNLFGMIAYIEVGIPESYSHAILAIYRDVFRKDALFGKNIHDYPIKVAQYEKLLSLLRKQGKFEEIVRIHFYSRDVNVNKIKTVELKGTFAFFQSVKYFEKFDMNKVEKQPNGDVKLTFGIMGNDVFLDYLPKIKDFMQGRWINANLWYSLEYYEAKDTFELNRINRMYISDFPRFTPYTVTLTQADLLTAGVQADDLTRIWNQTQSSIKEKKDTSKIDFKEKVMLYTKHDLNTDNLKDYDTYYYMLRNIDITNNVYLYDILYIENKNRTTIHYYLNKNGDKIFSQYFKNGIGIISYGIKNMKSNLFILMNYKQNLSPSLFQEVNYEY